MFKFTMILPTSAIWIAIACCLHNALALPCDLAPSVLNFFLEEYLSFQMEIKLECGDISTVGRSVSSKSKES